MSDLSQVPMWALGLGGLVVVAQLAFEVYALVDMLRRPASELTLGGRKWLWAVIILGVNWVGAILYLLAGRRPVPASDPRDASTGASFEASAVDALYGPGADGPA